MADYLPADLLAAPAYAEVGLIVAMAAISGAYSFRNAADAQQSQYPVVVGNEFQFDFRHHPTLGTIGAFSRYGKAQAVHTVGSVLWRQLMWAIEHARGNVCAMQFLTNRTIADPDELPVGIEPVMQQSQAFLYEFDDFQAWFQSMQPLRQQYFRGLVLLQLQQLDKWLAGARDFSLNFASLWKCRTSILYYSTLALLDAENAISEQVFDTSVLEQPLQGDRWLGLGVARHHGTLQVLDSFLSQFPWLRGRKTHSIPKSDYQKWMPSTVIRRYRRQIACLLGTQERIGHNSRAVCEMFMRLKHIIDASYSHCNSDHLKRDDGDEKLGHGSEQPNLKDEGPSLVPDLTEAKAGDEAASGRPLGNAALSEPEPGKGGPSSTQQAGGDDDGVLEPPLKKPSGLSAECEVEQSSQPEPEPERPEARHDTSNLAAEKAPTTEEAPGPSAKAASRSKPSRSARRAERDMTVLSGIVDDALIWRAILNAMLYSTAPDSSDVLTSGIWGHVVPVI
ncbi:hypothetical protein N658DRAFT_511204 [Parathielavia hyrcaniae]|uniref:Uncharacterized protein n=1 Tax=Parathielavia hyrcaniae TaxID=113614 RepID=A0AAN6SXA6_9PEZI|nr:hypothetical protein N658DRAFT_511204 [Parathielavia hyrcaniae]